MEKIKIDYDYSEAFITINDKAKEQYLLDEIKRAIKFPSENDFGSDSPYRTLKITDEVNNKKFEILYNLNNKGSQDYALNVFKDYIQKNNLVVKNYKDIEHKLKEKYKQHMNIDFVTMENGDIPNGVVLCFNEKKFINPKYITEFIEDYRAKFKTNDTLLVQYSNTDRVFGKDEIDINTKIDYVKKLSDYKYYSGNSTISTQLFKYINKTDENRFKIEFQNLTTPYDFYEAITNLTKDYKNATFKIDKNNPHQIEINLDGLAEIGFEPTSKLLNTILDDDFYKSYQCSYDIFSLPCVFEVAEIKLGHLKQLADNYLNKIMSTPENKIDNVKKDSFKLDIDM